MIKTKIISLVLASTMVGGLTGAGIISLLNKNTQTAVNTINSQAVQMEKASSLMGQAKTTITNLDSSISKLTAENIDTTKKINALHLKIETLNKELSKSNSNKDTLQKELTLATSKLTTLNETISKNTETIAAQKKTIDGLRLALHFVGESQRKAQKEVDTLTAENAKDQATIKSLNTKLEAAQNSAKQDSESNSKTLNDINNTATSQETAINNAKNNATTKEQAFQSNFNSLNSVVNNK